eukprot:gnl/Dysnectes_brevis/5701_a8360_412.p1 GENE.gnl/Dysnectes_brevis/5701_a8360_412~~gnl/Dysnectes_brevis/5701_a8360_412.p1  ORF type:complete len:497 (-),score=38.03 gnl/Dysnectes_brevis/5701_a8360_412:26-1480(-)
MTEVEAISEEISTSESDTDPNSKEVPLLENYPNIDDEEVCGVCFEPHSDCGNLIVFCDGCDAMVHQDCYALSDTDIEGDEWYCDVCVAIMTHVIPSKKRPACVFCMQTEGPMRRTSNSIKQVPGGGSTEWAHPGCYRLMPGSCYDGTVRILDMSAVGKATSTRKCFICKQRGGRMVGCSPLRVKCTKCFHPWCCLTSTVARVWTEDMGDEDRLHPLCPSHAVFDWDRLKKREERRARMKLQAARVDSEQPDPTTAVAATPNSPDPLTPASLIGAGMAAALLPVVNRTRSGRQSRVSMEQEQEEEASPPLRQVTETPPVPRVWSSDYLLVHSGQSGTGSYWRLKLLLPQLLLPAGLLLPPVLAVRPLPTHRLLHLAVTPGIVRAGDAQPANREYISPNTDQPASERLSRGSLDLWAPVGFSGRVPELQKDNAVGTRMLLFVRPLGLAPLLSPNTNGYFTVYYCRLQEALSSELLDPDSRRTEGPV